MHCSWNEGGHHHNMRFGMLIAVRAVCMQADQEKEITSIISERMHR